MIVANRHHHHGQYDEGRAWYIGRAGKIARQEMARGAQDATLLGNPFRLEHYTFETRDECLADYRRWLFAQLKGAQGHRTDHPRDQQVELAKLLARLPEDAYLICSCAPGPCHGDVIVKAAAWIREQAAEAASLGEREHDISRDRG